MPDHWLTAADREDGVKPGVTASDSDELRELCRRNRLLEQENEVPVAVMCRVLNLCRQACYRWLEAPVTDADWIAAHRANALFVAHHDDAEFGYRFLVAEARDASQPMADRTAWRICSAHRWWSVFGKPKAYGEARRPGAPAHGETSDGCIVHSVRLNPVSSEAGRSNEP